MWCNVKDFNKIMITHRKEDITNIPWRHHSTDSAPRRNWKAWIANSRGTTAFSKRSQSPPYVRDYSNCRWCHLLQVTLSLARVSLSLFPPSRPPQDPLSLQNLFSLSSWMNGYTHPHTHARIHRDQRQTPTPFTLHCKIVICLWTCLWHVIYFESSLSFFFSI